MDVFMGFRNQHTSLQGHHPAYIWVMVTSRRDLIGIMVVEEVFQVSEYVYVIQIYIWIYIYNYKYIYSHGIDVN